MKNLGFSDEFFELLRYEYFDRYGYYVHSIDDNNRLSWKLLMGYEKQHFVNTIKSEKYRKEMDYVFANSGDCKISEFLKEYRGKVVVAYFWSEQFGYYDNMMELMRQLQSDYASKGVELVSIAEMNYSNKKISKVFEETIPGRHYFLSSKERIDLFGFLFFGDAVIIDKEGSMQLYMPFVSQEMADYFRKKLDEVLRK